MSPGIDSPKNRTNVRISMFRAYVRVLSAVAPHRAEAVVADAFLSPIRRTRPRAPEVLGRTAHAFRVVSEPADLQAWDWGDGPTVLLVHGWNGSASQMSPFVAPLVDAGFYVVAFDHPAHGLSSGKRVSIVDMAAAIRAVGKKVGPIAGVIAHSLGAPATALAMNEGLSVKRAVFIAPPIEPSRYFLRLAAQLGLSKTRTAGATRALANRVGRTFESLDLRSLAAQMTAKLLVMHDRDDAEVPWAEGAAIAAGWSGARLTTLHGLGHVKPLRNRAVIAEAVSFLSPPQLHVVRQSA
jgi:pimeloyl-ACP methyl ester carboxylesterase